MCSGCNVHGGTRTIHGACPRSGIDFGGLDSSAGIARTVTAIPTTEERFVRSRLCPLPELNQTITVQPDGYITLKSAGTIVAEGLTIPELTEKIRQAYSGVLHDPIITIELKDFDKPYFIAAGPGLENLESTTYAAI